MPLLTCRLLAAITLSIIFSIAEAASFDCAQARSKIEKLICTNTELSKLDSALGRAYANALSDLPSDDVQDLVKSQQTWIKSVRNKCLEVECLQDSYRARLEELMDAVTDLYCDRAINTAEMDGCNGMQLERLDREMNKTYSALLKEMETPDCCFSTKHDEARTFAIDAQALWLKFREAECRGHYATMSNGTLRGSFYSMCAISLTKDRIKQLSRWGTVDLISQPKKANPLE
jgi:uncharacterized protein YecT (DUF1311 family)